MTTTRKPTASRWRKGGAAMQAVLATLAKAMERLPQRQQDVIVMTYWDRLPGVKTAALMGITVSEAVSLRREAEAALLKAIGEPHELAE